MYAICVKHSFIAQHYLIGGDWGPENELHSHHYQLELILEGDRLDRHGYLVDIVELEALLKEIIGIYQDKTLNDSPGFKDLNPSVEHFSRLLCLAFDGRIQAENISMIEVKLWETNSAWASYRKEKQKPALRRA